MKSFRISPFDENDDLYGSDDALSQARLACARLATMIVEQGIDPSDVFRITVFVVGRQHTLERVAEEVEGCLGSSSLPLLVVGATGLQMRGQLVQLDVLVAERDTTKTTTTFEGSAPEEAATSRYSHTKMLPLFTEMLLIVAIILGLFDVTRDASLIVGLVALVCGVIWTLIEWIDQRPDDNAATSPDVSRQPLIQVLAGVVGVLTALLLARIFSESTTNGSWGNLVILTVGAAGTGYLSYLALRFYWKKRVIAELAGFEFITDRWYPFRPLFDSAARLKASMIVPASLVSASGIAVVTSLYATSPVLNADSLSGTWLVGSWQTVKGTVSNEDPSSVVSWPRQSWTLRPIAGCTSTDCSYAVTGPTIYRTYAAKDLIVREIGSGEWQGSFSGYGYCGATGSNLVPNGYFDNDTLSISLVPNKTLFILIDRRASGTALGLKHNCTTAGEEIEASAVKG